MDKYYGNVCELDIIFNFQKAYFILDELLLAGEMQESSKKNVLRCISQQDSLEDMEVSLSPDSCSFPSTTSMLPPFEFEWPLSCSMGLLNETDHSLSISPLSHPGAIGLMLFCPRLRKMWSQRLCSDLGEIFGI
jgi:hypothetical protein